MKAKSVHISRMDRLMRFFMLGGLIAAMAFTASAVQYFHINGNPGSINSVTTTVTGRLPASSSSA